MKIHQSGKNTQDFIIYNTADGKASVTLYSKDGTLWMNQIQLAELFDTSKQNIGQHIASILKDKELNSNSVVKNYFTTASDGKEYNVTFYSLDMILDRVKFACQAESRHWRHLSTFGKLFLAKEENRFAN